MQFPNCETAKFTNWTNNAITFKITLGRINTPELIKYVTVNRRNLNFKLIINLRVTLKIME